MAIMPANIYGVHPDGATEHIERLMPGEHIVRENVIIDGNGEEKALMIRCSEADVGTDLFFVLDQEDGLDDREVKTSTIQHVGTVTHDQMAFIPFQHQDLGRLTLLTEHQYLFSRS